MWKIRFERPHEKLYFQVPNCLEFLLETTLWISNIIQSGPFFSMIYFKFELQLEHLFFKVCLVTALIWMYSHQGTWTHLITLQMNSWQASAIIKKTIDDSDSVSLSDRKWRRGEGRRALSEMILSSADPSVNPIFKLQAFSLISFLLCALCPSFCVALSCLQSHYRVLYTGQAMTTRQLPSWGKCRGQPSVSRVLCFLSFRPVLWNININAATQSLPHK